MKKMRFSEKQKDVTITTPEDGITDVIILTNETVVTEKNEQSESDKEVTSYEYDGNIFRTYKEITEDMIRADLDYYLNYNGDEKPTDEMVEYANKAIDEYTMNLIDGGCHMRTLVESLKRLYKDNRLTKEQLLQIVESNKITIEEYNYIVGFMSQ